MPATTPKVRKSIAILLFIVLALFLGLVIRIAWIQLVEGAKLTERANTQLKESRLLQSPRGTIADRNGRELAISNLTKSLYANPQHLNKDPVDVANMLAPLLGMKAEEISGKLAEPAGFIWLKRMLEPDVAQKITALIKEHNIRGLEFVEESKRYYPNNCLAAHVLGFVGIDDVGLSGVEMTMDKTIKGVLLHQAVDTDNHGIPIFKSILSFSPTKQEKSIYLTIDSTIQFIVEQSLDKTMTKTKAQAATIIVMNPRTGEILAMASRPTYDPNLFYRYNENNWKNRAISIIYEPGSTFKSVVAAAALQEKLVTANENFVDKGFVEVSGRRIQNWSGDSYGRVSFTDIIKNSINTGFVQVGLRLGAMKLNEYAKAFGFGKITGIELPGEEEGLLFNPQEMRDSDIASMSIGQGIAVTPLQLLTAVCAIANDGVLLKPHIIKEIHNADGSLATAVPTEVLKQVISPDTAKELAGLMEKVVSEGGGKRAAVKGYRFAGKTGTAEKFNENGGGYKAGRYIASFVGFGPVDDPQLAVLVVIDDPDGIYYGGEIAAPVFSEIMPQILRYLNIRPQTEVAEVAANVPQAASQPSEQTVVTVPKGKILVPAVFGKTIREAGDNIIGAGLVFIPSGSGIAVRQSIPPNTAVDPGTEITIYFEAR